MTTLRNLREKHRASIYRAFKTRSEVHLRILEEDIYTILLRQNYRCNYCNVHHANTKLALDHIIPIKKRGAHALSNLQFLCTSCNTKKKDRVPLGYKKPLYHDEIEREKEHLEYWRQYEAEHGSDF